jgi:hypothetical protein
MTACDDSGAAELADEGRERRAFVQATHNPLSEKSRFRQKR